MPNQELVGPSPSLLQIVAVKGSKKVFLYLSLVKMGETTRKH
jgi:hypothetical protein